MGGCYRSTLAQIPQPFLQTRSFRGLFQFSLLVSLKITCLFTYVIWSIIYVKLSKLWLNKKFSYTFIELIRDRINEYVSIYVDSLNLNLSFGYIQFGTRL